MEASGGRKLGIPTRVAGGPKLWTYHPSPLPDESLSSWLYRVSVGNSTCIQTFCQKHWPHLRWLWYRDVDRQSTFDLIEGLAQGTGTPIERALRTGLASFEDIIFNKIDPISKVPFILRMGIYHRLRRHGGQQFCPTCLSQGEVYYRLRWRFAFATSCLTHGVTLHNCCPKCGASVAFHRTRKAQNCHCCKAPLTGTISVDAPPALICFEHYLDDVVAEGQHHLGAYGLTRSNLIFGVLRQVLRILSTGWRGTALREQVASYMPAAERPKTRAIAGSLEFERRNVADRQLLMILAGWLIEDWPDRFVHTCAEAGMWNSWALKDGDQLPWCFVQPVRDHLFKPAYSTSSDTRAQSRQPSLFPADSRKKRHAGARHRPAQVLSYELKTRQLELPLDEASSQASAAKLQREIRKRTVRRKYNVRKMKRIKL